VVKPASGHGGGGNYEIEEVSATPKRPREEKAHKNYL